MFVPTRALLADIASFISTDQSAAANNCKLFGAKVGLIKAAVAPSKDTVLADVMEADFTGYAQKAVTAWTAVFDDLSGKPSVRTGSNHWQPTDAVSPNVIYGQILVDTAGTTLLGVEIFDTPVNLPDANEAFDSEVTFSFPTGALWGLGLVG